MSELSLTRLQIDGRTLNRKALFVFASAAVQNPQQVPHEHGACLPGVVHAGQEFAIPECLARFGRNNVQCVAWPRVAVRRNLVGQHASVIDAPADVG